MLHRMKKALVGVVLLLGVLNAFPSQAFASPEGVRALSTSTAAPSVEKIPVSSGMVAASFAGSCFGYVGDFMDGSSILVVDWNGGGADECFGIAPNREIYHAWPTSGRWIEMPNNGLADDTDTAFLLNGNRTVAVFVNGKGDYCSSLITTWRPWVPC